MNLRQIVAATVVTLAGLFSYDVLAGHFEGNGADMHPASSQAAWYTSQDPVFVCISRADDFPYSRNAIADALRHAFRQWLELAPRASQPNSPLHWPREFTILAGSCPSDAGDARLPSRDEPLRVYAGIESDKISAIRARYNDPFAFVHQDAYDASTGRSAGYIWLSPRFGNHFTPSSLQLNHTHDLQALILHEVGHIFGVPHLDGTIMRADIADVLVSKGFSREQRIESDALLYWDSARAKAGDFVMNGLSITKSLSHATLQRILGASHVPPERATLSLRYGGTFAVRYLDLSGRVVGEVYFTPKMPEMVSGKDSHAVFKRYKDTGASGISDARGRESNIHVGQVTIKASRQTYPAVFVASVGNHAEIIFFDENKIPQRLFVADDFQ